MGIPRNFAARITGGRCQYCARVRARGPDSGQITGDLGTVLPANRTPGLIAPRPPTAAVHPPGRPTYLATGDKETRAWTIHEGGKAPAAAGLIHTDFERGFIAAEIVHYDDLIALGSHAKAREAGKLRIEGKEYVVKDGEVVDFRCNVQPEP